MPNYDSNMIYLRKGEREKIEKTLKRKVKSRDFVEALLEKLKIKL